MDRWMIGGLSIVITGLTRLLLNVSRCELLTLYVFHLFAPYHKQEKKTTDAITSDNPPRHIGTPKDIDELAYKKQDKE